MTLFLDLDGPVLDVSARYHAVYLESFGIGGTPLDLESYWKARQDGVPEDTLLRNSSRLDRTTRSARLESDDLLALDRPWTEIVLALQRSELLSKTVIVTYRRRPDPVEHFLDRMGLRSGLGGLLCRGSATGNISKAELVSNAGIFWDPLDWFCGDTDLEIDAAREMGIKNCSVSFGMESRERLERKGPDLLIDTPAALARWMEQL